MKKVWTRMICSVLLFACCILPSTAMAVEGKEANVKLRQQNLKIRN